MQGTLEAAKALAAHYSKYNHKGTAATGLRVKLEDALFQNCSQVGKGNTAAAQGVQAVLLECSRRSAASAAAHKQHLSRLVSSSPSSTEEACELAGKACTASDRARQAHQAAANLLSSCSSAPQTQAGLYASFTSINEHAGNAAATAAQALLLLDNFQQQHRQQQQHHQKQHHQQHHQQQRRQRHQNERDTYKMYPKALQTSATPFAPAAPTQAQSAASAASTVQAHLHVPPKVAGIQLCRPGLTLLSG